MTPNPNPSPEVHEDDACAFVDCPPGLFRWQDIICFKSEYSSKAGQQDAYCVSSGEYFWGGTSGDFAARRALIVTPLTAALSPQTLPAPGEVGEATQPATLQEGERKPSFTLPDRNCAFCGPGWSSAHKHGCSRAMEDYTGGRTDD